MFNFRCATLKLNLDITSFKPNSALCVEPFSPTSRTLPKALVNQCLTFCNQCFDCKNSKNGIILQLKRYILLICGYITCFSIHIDRNTLCIRRVAHPLTLQQKEASRFLFGQAVLQHTCPKHLSYFNYSQVFADTIYIIKRLPSLKECLEKYPTRYFSKGHLLSKSAFKEPYQLTQEMFLDFVRPHFIPLLEENHDLLHRFFRRLREYFILLLGMTFEKQNGRLFLISTPAELTFEQKLIYNEHCLFDLLLPEYELFNAKRIKM
jgi:hypothetical protein